MKKMVFILPLMAFASFSRGQISLSGSSYTQDFNSLSSGLPEAWQTDTNAKAGTIGGSAAFTALIGTITRWNNTSGGFKNVASANGFANFAAGTTTLQASATDRALGVKQTGTFGDPGAAFMFSVAHTYKLKNFKLNFKLQSLDSSGGSKSTTWIVQYGIGSSPTGFTTVGSAYTVGGNTFTNTACSVSFGTALDDVREPVWIRIVSLAASTGSGSRTTSAIDDVSLTWTGTAVPGFRPFAISFSPANGASGVEHGTVLQADFNRELNAGTSGAVYIKNETDNTTQTIDAGSPNFKISGKKMTIAGVQLSAGKTYHVSFDSTLADTAGAPILAVKDTTDWRFTTVPVFSSAFVREDFETACVADHLPSGWVAFSKNGNEHWQCGSYSGVPYSMEMYGNDGAGDTDNEDWLIMPLIEPPLKGRLDYSRIKSVVDQELDMYWSSNYAGSGTPDSATWTPIATSFKTPDMDAWAVGSASALPSGFVHFALVYKSSTADACHINVDSVIVRTAAEVDAIDEQKARNNSIRAAQTAEGRLELFTNLPAGEYSLAVWDITGKEMLNRKMKIESGEQTKIVDMPQAAPGMYMLKLFDEKARYVTKFTAG